MSNTDLNTDLRRTASRFIKYSSVGFTTFLGDLALLYVFIEYLDVHYLIATMIAFSLAVSVNYGISRIFVFKGTHRSFQGGYGYFFLIAGVALASVSALMYVAVDILHQNYVLSRITIAAIVGFWTYLMNLYFNFQVVGKEH